VASGFSHADNEDVIKRAGLLLALVVSSLLVVSGCGGGSRKESLIPLSRVHAAFGENPKHLDSLMTLRNIASQLPYGDLDEYTVYIGQERVSEAGRPGTEVATVTVFASVAGARRASIRLLHGGECIDHPSPSTFSEWATCKHLRVSNVLIIMAPDISGAHRETLTGVLGGLGTPTSS
jgi:hypothetical protein